MSSGTAKLPNFIPVHEIELPAPIMDNLMAYHAITGCDTASQFAGKRKKTRPLHYMPLGPFNGLQNWQYAQISTKKSMPKFFFHFCWGYFLPNGLN
jgi:hypothetical protein